ncbi:MAG: plasmid pRiA4b ORF-3 family protein [Anaerolineales bacterium]|nr:plasmid pRiA4b ORF-3 family protein [Anaerolineales bacterium]
MEKKHVYQLKISLDEIQPTIWRRIQVPADTSLFQLHFILQLTMGWTNSHLHEYQIDGHTYGDPDNDEFNEFDIRDERDYQLQQVLPTTGLEFSYLYDFGDSWQHTLLLEAVLDVDDAPPSPACLDGARACPPEDVGGIYGYEEFLTAISDPDHPEHEDYLMWAGKKTDPEAFDREAVDRTIKNVERSEMVRVYQRYYSTEKGPELKLYQAVSTWLESLDAAQQAQIRNLPVRQDAVTLLTYVNDNRISGTQGTGNFPLKAIREVAPHFVQKLVLEEKIGDRVRKIRSADDVWPIYFLHALYHTGGLMTGGSGRRFNLTLKGLRFLQSEPAVQVWYLLESWWFHTNWLIAYPISGMGDRLPYDFQYYTLHQLLTYPAEKPILFQDFADHLIQVTNLKWSAPDAKHARRSLRNAIERMVIDRLEDFRAVQPASEDEWIGQHRISHVKSFTLTKTGRGLLQALAGDLF